MTCLEVRERLTEHSLGLLSDEDAREVERHLEWCPGCRKEWAELRDGLGTMALALVPAEPPASLEDRVVEKVSQAAGRRRTMTRHGIRALAAATLAALMVALGAVGWVLAQRQTVQDARRLAADQLKKIHQLQLTLQGLGANPFEAVLQATPAAEGFSGRAVIYSTPDFDDLIIVDVVAPEASLGPFTVQYVDRSGRTISGGHLTRTTNGDYIYWETSGLNLSKGSAIFVFDRFGRNVLTGTVHRTAGA